MATIRFNESSSEGKQAIVVSFDLCGFSNFCNHPEAYAILPRFISKLFELLDSRFLTDMEAFWDGTNFKDDRVPAPDFIKYTGDGALMIWFLSKNAEERQSYCTAIVKAMRKYQKVLAEAIPQWEVQWQINRLPSPARFGIATGLVHPLKAESLTSLLNEPIDYAGYCINLAVRLQDHCPKVGFLIHELLFPRIEGLVKLLAHNLKGVRTEPVLIFGEDLCITIDEMRAKFLPTGAETDSRSAATLREPGLAFLEDGKQLLNQPRFEAIFMRGTKLHRYGYLPEARDEWIFIYESKDSTGKLVGHRRWYFRLQTNGNPLIYQFVKDEPHLESISPRK